MATAQEKKSDVITPEVLALIEKLAFTPEKLAALAQEMKKPYIDPATVEREARERKQSREAYQQGVRMQKLKQERCPHKYKGGALAISLVHNFPDRMTRGICNRCGIWLQPQHYEVGFDQTPVLIPEHPKYHLVHEVELELTVR